MEEGVFHLHKWHSNLLELEGHQRLKEDVPLKQVRVKLEMGTSPKETKILGDPWNNTEDELSIGFMKLLESVAEGPLTKRKLLSAVNGVYNPLGLTSPALITGKILCSETSLHKLKWDERVSTQRRRQRCNKNCPSPRALPMPESQQFRQLSTLQHFMRVHQFATISLLQSQEYLQEIYQSTLGNYRCPSQTD